MVATVESYLSCTVILKLAVSMHVFLNATCAIDPLIYFTWVLLILGMLEESSCGIEGVLLISLSHLLGGSKTNASFGSHSLHVHLHLLLLIEIRVFGCSCAHAVSIISK